MFCHTVHSPKGVHVWTRYMKLHVLTCISRRREYPSYVSVTRTVSDSLSLSLSLSLCHVISNRNIVSELVSLVVPSLTVPHVITSEKY